MNKYFVNSLSQLGFGLGIVILALEPVLWLLHSWIDPSYDSAGLWVALWVLALFLWSFTSPVITTHAKPTRRVILLLTMTSSIRLAGQLFGVNMISAMTLVIDLYALGLMLQLEGRQRAVSPIGLAILFAFTLPLERVVQRTFGYALQQLSADTVYYWLNGLGQPVQQIGVRLILAGQDVLIDLPCSGARGLLQLLMLFVVLATVTRPSWRSILIGLMIALLAAWLGNSIRVLFLSWGIAYPNDFGGIQVMLQPWHDLIGLLALVIAAMPILFWANSIKTAPKRVLSRPTFTLSMPFYNKLAILFPMVALSIVLMPTKPVDVAKLMPAPQLPLYIASYRSQPMPLQSMEQEYYRQYGGGAAKAFYGDAALLLVTTTSPLRHLHAPDVCLRGAGFKVQYLGSHFTGLPTALYLATAPDKTVYQVSATYISEHHRSTSNISEVVWYWLKGTDRQWTMVQRIVPVETGALTSKIWDEAVFRALDLSPNPTNALQVF